ncbi:hypothetical protein F66182_10733 [Fusarium sp. NRRL 66182]|nr:hypothetical protein F66182_10733 [Fusarium sp. NRRL 66182]
MKKIKGGTSSLKRYHQQLLDLKRLSTCISENPLLQTPEVGSQTQAILSIINNNHLNSLLQKGRFLRTWGLLYREQDLIETFASIERQKTNLSLAIEHIQSKALYRIQSDIQNMADRQTSRSPTDDKPMNLQGPSQGAIVPFTTNNTGAIDPNFTWFINTFLPHVRSRRTNMNQGDTPKPEEHEIPTPAPTADAQWNGMVAGPGSNQRNGCVFKVDAEFSQELFPDMAPSYHNNPINIGAGVQNNGHKIICKGSGKGFRVPDISRDRWYGGAAFAHPGLNGIGGEQINGFELIQVKDD